MQHNEEETIAQLLAQLIYRARFAAGSGCHRRMTARGHACAPKSKQDPAAGGKRVQGKLNCMSVMNPRDLPHIYLDLTYLSLLRGPSQQ